MHDPLQSLQSAFVHLDAFSVPGIGTFRRTQYSAVIDHQAGLIHPPGQRFVLEKGEGLVSRLEDFFFRFFELTIGKAKELVDAVGVRLKEEIKKAGRVRMAGIGALQRSGADGLVLVPEAGAELGRSSFFGLSPVAFQLSTVGAAGESEKKAAAERQTAMKGAPVQPPSGPKPKKRKRSMQPVIIVLLVLIMGLSGAGIIWQEEFQSWMVQVGLLDSTDTVSDTLPAPDDSSAIAKVPVDTAKGDLEPGMVDASQPAEKPSKTKKVTIPSKATSKPKTTTVKPKTAPKPAKLADPSGVGEYAAAGTYYLIVGARRDLAEAQRIAQNISGNGIQAKILVPRVEGPHYKIYVYKDSSKDKVISKMVEWKTRFPEKSWIFWPGM